MPTLTVRWPDDAPLAAIQTAAAARGISAEEFARRALALAAAAPVVRECYGYRAIGPGKATIIRHGDGPNAIGGGAEGLSQEQAEAYQRAKTLMQRNEPGDQAQAVALLSGAFEIVVEA